MSTWGTHPLLDGVTTTATGARRATAGTRAKAYQATVSGAGAVTATVVIEVSNHDTSLGWLTLGTITLSGTTSSTDGFVSNDSWAVCRARVTAITGTSATVYAFVSTAL